VLEIDCICPLGRYIVRQPFFPLICDQVHSCLIYVQLILLRVTEGLNRQRVVASWRSLPVRHFSSDGLRLYVWFRFVRNRALWRSWSSVATSGCQNLPMTHSSIRMHWEWYSSWATNCDSISLVARDLGLKVKVSSRDYPLYLCWDFNSREETIWRFCRT